MLPVAATQQHAPGAGGLAAGDVDPPIAYHHRPGGIETEIAAGPLDHARLRLPAVAGLEIRRARPGRMMRAIVVAVGAGAAGAQPIVARRVRPSRAGCPQQAAAEP